LSAKKLAYEKDPEKYRKRAEAWRKNNPLKRRAARYFGRGIDLYAALLLLKKQKGRCALCRSVMDLAPGKVGSGSAVLDHDHKTGAVRGWIHSRCNLGLGYFRDEVPTLKKAIKYLESFNA
jgi:hypothetical protein